MKRILVIGDIMVDKYVYVDSTRWAPESRFLPVYDEERVEYRLGGAGNVAANISQIIGESGEVHLTGIFRPVDMGYRKPAGINFYLTNVCSSNLSLSMVKTRYVREGDILFRADNKKKFTEQEIDLFQHNLLYTLKLDEWDAVVFSDYDKGTITPDIVKRVREIGTKTIVVDSKRKDLRMYEGCTVLKLNESEWSLQQLNSYMTEELFGCVVITKGSKPTEVRLYDQGKSTPGKYVIHSAEFPVPQVKAVDVTGCGDTHTAAMTAFLCHRDDIFGAVHFANECASDVVQKFGTSVTSHQLKI